MALLDKAAILAAIHDTGGTISGNKITGGNISKAAKRLGVARRTLQNRMRFYGIPTGTAGRRKKRITYSRAARKYAGAATVGIAAVAAFSGAALLYRRKPTGPTGTT